MNSVIRHYEDRDHGAVRNLFIRVNRALAPSHLREAFESYIARSLAEEIDVIPAYYAARHGGFWVGFEGDVLVGTFGLECADDGAAELRRMYVDPRMRRRGVARALLERAETECCKRSCRRLVLSTSEIQEAAIALYRAVGFRLVREEIAAVETNKTVGGGLRRFHFEKELVPELRLDRRRG